MSTGTPACRSRMEASLQHNLALEDTVSLMVKVTAQLSSGTYDSTTQDTIVTLSSNLKLNGPSMESSHGQTLDSFQQVLRSSCRDQNLDLVSRVHLLEIIELRALKWAPNEHLTNYYSKKLAQLNNGPSKMSLCTPPPQNSPIHCLNTNAPEFTSHQLLTRRPSVTRPLSMTRPPPIVLQQPPVGRRKVVQETGDTKNGAMKEGFQNEKDRTGKYTVTLKTKYGEITLSSFNMELFCRAENIIKEKLALQTLMENSEIITIKSESSSSLEEKPIKSELTYNRNDLLKLATSPLCLVPPHNWDEIISQVPSMVKSPNSPLTYNRNDLLKLATSPLSLVPPHNWDEIISQVPSMVKSPISSGVKSPVPSMAKSPTIVDSTDDLMGKLMEDEANRARLQTDFYLR